MDRRTALTTGGMALLGLGLGGCATRSPVTSGRPSRPSLDLPPVQASWDRVIRTTVGLRPHRPAGFVLRAEALDAKTLIHNYGHGGSGHSLGWGTGSMAADMALGHPHRRAAVIGCGTVGLTAARQLQRRGFAVTIYTKTVPPDTTSNMALAGFTPTAGLVADASRTAAWDAQFRQAVEISYAQLQLLAGPRYGISWLDNYSTLYDLPQTDVFGTGSDLLPEHLRATREILQPGEHPFPSPYASRRLAMRIEPSIYLDALVRDVLAHRGQIVIRQFDTPRDLMTLSESLIVNCSGLGSRTIFADTALVPLKGQLTFLVPQPELGYRLSGAAASRLGASVSMMPRSDGIALGGTSERGVWDLAPNLDARQRIVDGHIALSRAMRSGAARQPLA